MDFLDLLAAFFQVHDYTQEYLMLNSDLVGLAALLLFLGGIAFWALLLFAAVVGVCRGIKRLYDSAMDVLYYNRRVSIPHDKR